MVEDGIFFKVLAHNDTGAAAGHQGGVVVPKDLSVFFPAVVNTTGPTTDVRLVASLFVDGSFKAKVNTRYQHQTWGGTRSPERRLTDNLGPLRNVATAGDLLLFRKNLDDEASIELHLVTKGSREFAHLQPLLSGRRWGVLDSDNPPVSQVQFEAAVSEIDDVVREPASAFAIGRSAEVSRVMRRARDRAFRMRVLDTYGRLCAFTSRRFEVPDVGHLGLDAAHIVPVQANGSDDPANGLPLTKDMHWAFDRGLVGVDGNRRIVVPEPVRSIAGNEFLSALHGRPINEASNARFRALDEAFAWHREHVLI